MPHPSAQMFREIPPRLDRQDDKCPTNAWGYIFRGDGHAWNLHVLSHKLLRNISGILLCCKKKSQSGVRKLNHKQEP